MNTVKPPVQIVTQRIVKPNFDLFYPVITGMSNTAVQHQVNTVICYWVNALLAKQDYRNNPQTEVVGWFELKSNERDILSLVLGNYAYPYHAAHGMTYLKPLTFDMQTGREYPLSALFKPGSDYIQVISDNIRIQIKERQIPLLNGFNGISPDQDYYIADKALVIFFQLYAITPYYVGFPMFPISVFDLQYMAVDGGIINTMATNS